MTQDEVKEIRRLFDTIEVSIEGINQHLKCIKAYQDRILTIAQRSVGGEGIEASEVREALRQAREELSQ